MEGEHHALMGPLKSAMLTATSVGSCPHSTQRKNTGYRREARGTVQRNLTINANYL